MDYTLLMILDMATGFAIAVMFIYCIIGMVYHIQLKDNQKLKEISHFAAFSEKPREDSIFQRS